LPRLFRVGLCIEVSGHEVFKLKKMKGLEE